MKLLMIVVTVLPILFSNAFGFGPELSDEYFKVAKTEVVELGEERGEIQAFLGDLGVVVEITDKLIALGEKIWPLVEKGKPVIHQNFVPYSVLPRINKEDTSGMAFYEMYGWSYPIRKKYKITYYNYLNVAVATFAFTVSAQYGGKYMERGSYLTGVMISPETIDVKWGFTFDANSALVGISNVSQNPLNPVAAATIEVNASLTNALTNIQKKMTYFVTGEGKIEEI